MKEHTGRLGTFGWLIGGKRGVEGYLYVLHRVTGIVLLGFLSMHVFFTSTRLFGEAMWAQAMAITHSPLVKLLEYGVFIAFVFHALNGVRLIAIELGFAVGSPETPVFPYKGSIAKQRPLMIAMMVLTGVLILVSGFGFLRFPQ